MKISEVNNVMDIIQVLKSVGVVDICVDCETILPPSTPRIHDCNGILTEETMGFKITLTQTKNQGVDIKE